MRIINTDGVSGEFLSATPTQDTTFLLVVLSDGSLVEWNINHCRAVSVGQTSELVESAKPDVQQLKAKIRLALEQIKGAALNGDKVTMFHTINQAYAELSAIE